MSSEGDPQLAALAIAMRQGGEKVIRKAREAMKREADKIVALARSNCPVLTSNGVKMTVYTGEPGDLEASIRQIRSYDDENNGRLQIDVVVGNGTGADGDSFSGPAGVDLDVYALQMNEGLEPYGSGAFKLGPVSRQKAAAGHDVGGLFMDRALEARQDNIPESILAEIDMEDLLP
jgi:hypothetical protein